MNIICIQSTFSIFSISLIKDERIYNYISEKSKNHNKELAVQTKKIVEVAGLKFSDLDAVSVVSGPGSYTGLRIGISFVKGICFALNIPLIEINTFEIIKESLKNKISNKENNYFVIFKIKNNTYIGKFFLKDIEINNELKLIEETNINNYLEELDKKYFVGIFKSNDDYYEINSKFVEIKIYDFVDSFEKKTKQKWNAKEFINLYEFDAIYINNLDYF